MMDKLYDILSEVICIVVYAVLVMIPMVALIALVKFALRIMGVIG